MKNVNLAVLLSFFLTVPVVVFALEVDSEQREDETGIEIVVVTGVRSRDKLVLEDSRVTHSGPDNSDLLRLFPVGNRNSNGPLTRISQYRGLGSAFS